MEIGAHVREKVLCGIISQRFEAAQLLLYENLQVLLGLSGATAKALYWIDASIYLKRGENPSRIAQVERFQTHAGRALLGTTVFKGHQKIGELPLHFGPERGGRIFLLGRSLLHRDYHIRFYLNQRAVQVLGSIVAPVSLHLKVSPIHHHQGGLFGQLQHALLGGFLPHDHLDPSPLKRTLHLGEALQHKRVVSQICLGEIVRDSEEDNDRLICPAGPND